MLFSSSCEGVEFASCRPSARGAERSHENRALPLPLSLFIKISHAGSVNHEKPAVSVVLHFSSTWTLPVPYAERIAALSALNASTIANDGVPDTITGGLDYDFPGDSCLP